MEAWSMEAGTLPKNRSQKSKQKNFESIKPLDPKTFGVPKILDPKKVWVQKILDIKKMCPKKIMVATTKLSALCGPKLGKVPFSNNESIKFKLNIRILFGL